MPAVGNLRMGMKEHLTKPPSPKGNCKGALGTESFELVAALTRNLRDTSLFVIASPAGRDNPV